MSQINEIFKSIMDNPNIPVLNIGTRTGVTGYIDFITYDEVVEPVMKGTDIHGRNFIVLKFVINNIFGMQTFFKRYYGDGPGPSLWMGCGMVNLIETCGGIKQIQAELIRDIINEKKTIVTNEHRPNYAKEFEGQNVMLYDKKKWDAANVIQKAFKFYRYNPAYKMCHKIQIDMFNKIIN